MFHMVSAGPFICWWVLLGVDLGSEQESSELAVTFYACKCIKSCDVPEEKNCYVGIMV